MPMMVQAFEQLCIGQGFRYVTAFVELTCAVLLVPRTALFAATLLTVTLLVATATHHLFLIGGWPVPALVLGAHCAFVFYRLRPAGGFATLLAPSGH